VIASGGGNVIASGGGNVISSGGGNVISSGGGNVISSGGGNVISSGGGNFHLRDGNWLGSLLGNNVTAGNLWLAKDASFVQIYNGAPGGITMPQLASSVGTLTTSVTASNTFLRPQGASAAKARPVALAKATTRVRHKGVVIVRLKLTKAGRALVARRHKAKRKSQAKAIRLTITTRLKPKKGKAVTRTRRVTAKPVRTPYR
jgi:hypothetical protein